MKAFITYVQELKELQVCLDCKYSNHWQDPNTLDTPTLGMSRVLTGHEVAILTAAVFIQAEML